MGAKKDIDLEALLGGEVTTATDQEQTVVKGGELEVNIDLIYPDPNQPRKMFDEDKLIELSESIKVHGLIQAITVKDDGNGKYILIAGERRYRAHLLAGLKKIKANITSEYKEVTSEVQLIENIQRADLTPFEIALSVKIIWEQGKYTQKSELAKAIGKSAAYVSKCFSVFSLSNEILEDLKTKHNEIGLDILQEISRETDEEEQLSYYNGYLNRDITRENIRSEIKKSLENKKSKEEQLHDETYAKLIKDYLEDGALLINDNNVWSQSKKIDIYFHHQNDKEKLKAWFDEFEQKREAQEKEEANREKLNDKEYEKKVKAYIFTQNYAPNEVSSLYMDGKKISFENDKDRAKIKEWIETHKNNLKEKQKANKNEISSFIPVETFNENSTEYKRITNIDEITYMIKRAVNYGYRLDDDNKLRFGEGSDDLMSFDNCYETAIYNLYVELAEAKKEEETLYINKKDMYIVGYVHKNGVPHGGGARVRAINIDEAIEEAKEIYTDEANDKNYIFEAKPLNTFSSTVLFTIIKAYDEFEYDQNNVLSLATSIRETLEDPSFKSFKITIEGKPL